MSRGNCRNIKTDFVKPQILIIKWSKANRFRNISPIISKLWAQFPVSNGTEIRSWELYIFPSAFTINHLSILAEKPQVYFITFHKHKRHDTFSLHLNTTSVLVTLNPSNLFLINALLVKCLFIFTVNPFCIYAFADAFIRTKSKCIHWDAPISVALCSILLSNAITFRHFTCSDTVLLNPKPNFTAKKCIVRVDITLLIIIKASVSYCSLP